ncbi:chromosome partitioning protein ParA [Sinorhizobium meliloti]|nr:chromosome partitioning protein ParA [Sinorhizobium meliloti]RVK72705.1 chromosome partitioning protein ParA [Sinorhizobium meliloti]RVP75034.1 chromosome partitioning protein ParA [Sinorhizobium meliloti]
MFPARKPTRTHQPLGQTPQELEPQGSAAQEVAGLFSLLSEQASMITSKHERMKA